MPISQPLLVCAGKQLPEVQLQRDDERLHKHLTLNYLISCIINGEILKNVHAHIGHAEPPRRLFLDPPSPGSAAAREALGMSTEGFV